MKRQEKPVDYHAKTAVSQGEFTVVVRSLSGFGRAIQRKHQRVYYRIRSHAMAFS